MLLLLLFLPLAPSRRHHHHHHRHRHRDHLPPADAADDAVAVFRCGHCCSGILDHILFRDSVVYASRVWTIRRSPPSVRRRRHRRRRCNCAALLCTRWSPFGPAVATLQRPHHVHIQIRHLLQSSLDFCDSCKYQIHCLLQVGDSGVSSEIAVQQVSQREYLEFDDKTFKIGDTYWLLWKVRFVKLHCLMLIVCEKIKLNYIFLQSIWSGLHKKNKVNVKKKH